MKTAKAISEHGGGEKWVESKTCIESRAKEIGEWIAMQSVDEVDMSRMAVKFLTRAFGQKAQITNITHISKTLLSPSTYSLAFSFLLNNTSISYNSETLESSLAFLLPTCLLLGL